MELYINARPNGVGKTTFARTFLPKYADCRNFINADLIAQGLSPFFPHGCSSARWQASVERDQVFFATTRSFCFRDDVVGEKPFEVDSAAQEAGIQGAFFLSFGEGR